MEIGNIVTTVNDTHKRVIHVLGNTVSLEYYDHSGRQTETVSSPHCNFVSDYATKQFLECKTLWESGCNSFHAEMDRKKKRAHRLELSRKREFNSLKPQ